MMNIHPKYQPHKGDLYYNNYAGDQLKTTQIQATQPQKTLDHQENKNVETTREFDHPIATVINQRHQTARGNLHWKVQRLHHAIEHLNTTQESLTGIQKKLSNIKEISKTGQHSAVYLSDRDQYQSEITKTRAEMLRTASAELKDLAKNAKILDERLEFEEEEPSVLKVSGHELRWIHQGLDQTYRSIRDITGDLTPRNITVQSRELSKVSEFTAAHALREISDLDYETENISKNIDLYRNRLLRVARDEVHPSATLSSYEDAILSAEQMSSRPLTSVLPRREDLLLHLGKIGF